MSHTLMLGILIVLAVGSVAFTLLEAARAAQGSATATAGRRWYPGACVHPVGDRVLIIAGGIGTAAVALLEPAHTQIAPTAEMTHGPDRSAPPAIPQQSDETPSTDHPHVKLIEICPAPPLIDIELTKTSLPIKPIELEPQPLLPA